jgi:hypothetical protein
VNYFAINCINPCTRPFSFGAHGQLGLVAKQDTTRFIHYHVRAKRQAPQGAIFQLLNGLRIVDVCRNAEAAVVARPTRQTRTNTRVAVMLVEKRATSNVCGGNLSPVQVCWRSATAVARRGRMSDTPDLNWHAKLLFFKKNSLLFL